jgi:hypothetical protein
MAATHRSPAAYGGHGPPYTKTSIQSSTIRTGYVAIGLVAGRFSAAPVSRLKRAPCTGQVIVQWRTRPIISGRAACEQTFEIA